MEHVDDNKKEKQYPVKHVPKKSLGQNFLTSSTAKKLIVSSGNIQYGDIILEIGPGKGAITEGIIEKIRSENAINKNTTAENKKSDGFYIGVEKDDNLFLFLQEKFAQAIKDGIFILIHGDILEEKITDEIFEKIGSRTYKIIANIPYYITGEIIRKFLTTKHQPKEITLLVQKEVAERIVARSRGKKIGESLLSISIKIFGIPKYVETVKAKYFSPAPKVDSAIIHIFDISNPFANKNEEEEFFKFVKSAFKYKRKMLLNNLVQAGNNKLELEKAFSELSINLKSRAEDMNIENWKKLFEGMEIRN